ncbi:MAG: DUF6502 family protein [Steroidobacteraceae bacterium]
MASLSGFGLSGDARKHLLFAVRRVLRPIVRLLIRVGINYDQFVDVARGAYVESAIRDRTNNVPPTRDRITFVTGVSRQQVDYYIDNEWATPVAAPTLARVITEVIHRWHTDPNYLGPYGIPLELEFDAPQGRCFQNLVSQVDATASPGQVLEELLRAGTVTPSGEKRYRAVMRWFVVSEALSPHRIEYFGEALTHLALTLEHNFNLSDTENKRLERFVFADRGLSRKVLPNFEAYARDRTNRFLLDVDEWLAHSVGTDLSKADPRVEAGVNVFLYVEPPAEQQTLSALVQPPGDWSFRP